MKVELHLLQSVPPSNLNRDDSGAPKDAHFGGHRRARISSQSLKRAIRTSDIFRQIVSDRVGIRTRRSVNYIQERLITEHGLSDAAAHALARAAVEALLKKVGDDDRSNVLYYAARPELDDLASRLASDDDAVSAAEAIAAAQADLLDVDNPNPDQKKAADKKLTNLGTSAADIVKQFVKDYQGKTSAADIALFGRMLAEEPRLNIDAACQVAHAISIDRVAPSFDYFTAVDDLKHKDDDDKGAGMIGTTGFTSACFYRYSVIDADQLARNLGGDWETTRDAIRAFLTAAVSALPSGKQNSFAAQVRPEFVMAVVRHSGVPLSLVNAFAAPIRPDGHSLVYHGAEALNMEWIKLESMYAGLMPDEEAANVFVATPHSEALTNYPGDGEIDTAQYALSSRVVPNVRAVIDAVDEIIQNKKVHA